MGGPRRKDKYTQCAYYSTKKPTSMIFCVYNRHCGAGQTRAAYTVGSWS
ncbi:hypothetical protein L493_2019 [Bordetella bronchiseptica 99-R-0433]|nr:hypothetical protein L493_2019 [Bordetella bronchiseptica 99-R-0433]